MRRSVLTWVCVVMLLDSYSRAAVFYFPGEQPELADTTLQADIATVFVATTESPHNSSASSSHHDDGGSEEEDAKKNILEQDESNEQQYVETLEQEANATALQDCLDSDGQENATKEDSGIVSDNSTNSTASNSSMTDISAPEDEANFSVEASPDGHGPETNTSDRSVSPVPEDPTRSDLEEVTLAAPGVGPRMRQRISSGESAPSGGKSTTGEQTDDGDVARSAKSLIWHRSSATHQRPPTSRDSSVLFPGWVALLGQRKLSKTLPTCDGTTISAINPATGACQVLGTSVGCAEDHYFFLDPISDHPGCRRPSCPMDYLLFNGVCTLMDDPSACPRGMSLTLDEYDQGVCDCQEGYTLWPETRRCYPALRQGPCPIGRILAPPIDGHLTRCIDNACFRDGSLLWLSPGEAGCYPLEDPDAGCESERLLYLNRREELVCSPLGLRAIFDLPGVRCAGEALRDYSGKCRDRLTQSFRGR